MLKWLFCDSPFWSSLWNNLHTLHSPFWYLVPNQYYIQILLYHVLNTNHCGIMVWHNYTFGIPLPIKLHKAKACFVFYSNLIPFVLQGLSGAVSPKLILFYFIFFPPISKQHFHFLVHCIVQRNHSSTAPSKNVLLQPYILKNLLRIRLHYRLGVTISK